MFERVSRFVKSIDIYYKSAFNLYLISTILSIIFGLFFSGYILFDFGDEDKILRLLLLNLFLILMALNLENINFSFLRDSKILRYLLICSLLVVSGILVYNYIIVFKDSIMEMAKILQYNAILLALLSLFASFNLRFDFYSFFDFAKSAFFALNIFILFAMLFGISILSIDFLFRFDVELYRLYYAFCVCIATISFVFFIGKVSLLNHHLVAIKEITEEITSKMIKHLFLIFSIFSYFYAGILVLYFVSLFLGLISPQYSAIHLIIWFSFFGIMLFWQNQVLQSKYLGKFFLALLLLLNIIALYSIFVRIYQYGFTPSRYFVLISCVFLFVSIISSLFLRHYLKILFYLFAILCVFSTFGSFSAINVSIDSQLRALRNLEMNVQNYKRISNIYLFLSRHVDKNEIADYGTFLDLQKKDSQSYQTYRIPQVINVRGFDTLIEGISLDDRIERHTKGGFEFILQYDSLVISKGGWVIWIDNFYDFMMEAANGKGAGAFDGETLIIEIDTGNNKANLYIDYFGYDEERKTINKIKFDALLKIGSKIESLDSTKKKNP